MIQQEIERKYLVVGEFMQFVTHKYYIKQGYICKSNGKTVRVRTKNDKAFLTIKGSSTDMGLSRFEFEIEIPFADAEHLFSLAENSIISKVRYIVPWNDFLIEIDEFMDKNKGLLIAEIEFNNKSENVETPAFLGAELTGKPQFYNSFLSKFPFTEWSDMENFTP